jgi:hypothetical protein
MSASIVNSLAKKANLSVGEVESKWEKAKEIANKEYKDVPKDSDKYYAIVVGILKNMLGIKEQITTSNVGDIGKGPIMKLYKRNRCKRDK